MWRPKFIISIINANDRISRVKPADIGQTKVNLGHHLETESTTPIDPLDQVNTHLGQTLVKTTVKSHWNPGVCECLPELLPRSRKFT
jgi:hypothetical protein